MRQTFLEEVFEVTITCNNGNERTIKKSVYCEPFKFGKFRTTEERIAAATFELEWQHYYRIKHLKTVKHEITIA